MSRRPVPRQQVFDVYWRLAAERHRVFEKRLAGEPGPWTSDPILQTYKFCNTFRAVDRVSQYMIREVCYSDQVDTFEDRAFQIVAFRTFSNIATWDGVRATLGRSPVVDDLQSGRLERALDGVRLANGGLYTGAFILCATDAYGRGLKHLNHVALFEDMFVRNDFAGDLLAARSLREVYSLLHEYPLMGDFMSYQTAIDLNYSALIDFSENDFTQPGPGALRGIRKVFIEADGMRPDELVMRMVDRQEEEFARLGLSFGGLFGRPLHAIDAQNLFCETDKYCREAFPELTSARSRIKARHSRGKQLPQLYFPPKPKGGGVQPSWPRRIPTSARSPRPGHMTKTPPSVKAATTSSSSSSASTSSSTGSNDSTNRAGTPPALAAARAPPGSALPRSPLMTAPRPGGAAERWMSRCSTPLGRSRAASPLRVRARRRRRRRRRTLRARSRPPSARRCSRRRG